MARATTTEVMGMHGTALWQHAVTYAVTYHNVAAMRYRYCNTSMDMYGSGLLAWLLAWPAWLGVGPCAVWPGTTISFK